MYRENNKEIDRYIKREREREKEREVERVRHMYNIPIYLGMEKKKDNKNKITFNGSEEERIDVNLMKNTQILKIRKDRNY